VSPAIRARQRAGYDTVVRIGGRHVGAQSRAADLCAHEVASHITSCQLIPMPPLSDLPLIIGATALRRLAPAGLLGTISRRYGNIMLPDRVLTAATAPDDAISGIIRAWTDHARAKINVVTTIQGLGVAAYEAGTHEAPTRVALDHAKRRSQAWSIREMLEARPELDPLLVVEASRFDDLLPHSDTALTIMTTRAFAAQLTDLPADMDPVQTLIEKNDRLLGAWTLRRERTGDQPGTFDTVAPYDILQAWQQGWLSARDTMRLLDVGTYKELHEYCISSGVEIRVAPVSAGPSNREDRS
jgi:hypothetical protein